MKPHRLQHHVEPDLTGNPAAPELAGNVAPNHPEKILPPGHVIAW
ncbi:hypothetical protein [Streptomyces spororaveus]|nr:hypothetical protein [Streptomyces spororaveus]